MKFVIIILIVLALSADIHIYRSVICVRFRRLPVRIGYIIYSIATLLAGSSVLLLYGPAAEAGPAAVITVMWAIWFFLVNGLPKIVFLAGAGLDRLLFHALRHPAFVFRPAAMLLGAALVFAMIHGALIGKNRIKVNSVEVCSERLPESFDGYRIVHFSDLHLGTMCSPERRMKRMVKAINGLEPDLVANTGDVINIRCSELTSRVADILFRIESRDGVWSVEGNHDLGSYIPDTTRLSPTRNRLILRDMLAGIGWPTLVDSSTYIRRGGDSILLTGLGFAPDNILSAKKQPPGADLDRAFGGASGHEFSIVLSHSPGVWGECVRRGFGDLVLSGHTHAMQIKLQMPGRQWSPAKYVYREWSGLYQKNSAKGKSSLYVNDGIGCVIYPMRIGAYPELTLLTLKRCE